MSKDEKWMRVALDLARQGEGMTRPNPPVGAVVVKNGRKIGAGFHRRCGGPHAEVEALQAAGTRARGGEIYVTLEPCSTHGLTPPCTDAIVEAGIKRVVVAGEDPNPNHAGRGLAILRRQGVAVETGVCAAEARRILDPFSKWIVSGRPWLTLKLGMTIDGHIADRNGRSKWITGQMARERVQDLRRRADAIMVGAGTALADDPSLLPRPAKGRRPLRIVLDECGCLPPVLKLFADGKARQTVVATTAASEERWRDRIAALGAQVWVLPSRKGHVSLKSLLKRLGAEGCLHVFCEGGSKLAGDLAQQDLIDEYIFFIAPCLFGAEAKPAVGGSGWLMKNRKQLQFVETSPCGDDIMVRARGCAP